MTAEDLHKELADEINREHRLGLSRMGAAVPHFIRAGTLLTEVKKQTPKGEWTVWVKDHFEDSARTAQLYMRLAHYRDEIPEDMPSLAEAMRWLNGRARTDSGHWALPGSKIGNRSARKRATRTKRVRERQALEREDRARIAKRRGGTVADGYSHLRKAIQGFERAREAAANPKLRSALEEVVLRLYRAEDSTHEVFAVDYIKEAV